MATLESSNAGLFQATDESHATFPGVEGEVNGFFVLAKRVQGEVLEPTDRARAELFMFELTTNWMELWSTWT